MANAPSSDGTTADVLIHVMIGGGSSFLRDQASWNYVPAGQHLGSTIRFGLNGHRIGGPPMDIPRPPAPRPGTPYGIPDEKPNPARPTLHQGGLIRRLSAARATTRGRP